MQKIIKKETNSEDMTQPEIELRGDFQSFAKPEQWKEIKEQIKTHNPPNGNKELCKMGYARFKIMSKLILRYQTYYPEKYEPQQNYLICPTCQKQCNGKAQLTFHRKQS